MKTTRSFRKNKISQQNQIVLKLFSSQSADKRMTEHHRTCGRSLRAHTQPSHSGHEKTAKVMARCAGTQDSTQWLSSQWSVSKLSQQNEKRIKTRPTGKVLVKRQVWRGKNIVTHRVGLRVLVHLISNTIDYQQVFLSRMNELFLFLIW